MSNQLVQRKYFLITVLFLWMVVGPLHLVGHDEYHSQYCEFCFQLSHQSVDSVDTEVLVEPTFCESEAIQSFYLFHISNSIATFHERRGPPTQLS